MSLITQNSQKIVFLFALALSTLLGCASEMPGLEATEISPPPGHEQDLSIAMADIEPLSSDIYRAFSVSFKNDTDRWIRFDATNIAFPEMPTQPEILLGKDLEIYFESVKRRNTVAQYNKALAVGSIYAVGSIAGIAGAATNNNGLAVIGLGSAAGAVTYGVVDGFQQSKDRAQFQAALPDSHLLKAFDIPPKMVVARWIIVKIPQDANYAQARIEATEIGQRKRNFLIQEKVPQTKKAFRPASAANQK